MSAYGLILFVFSTVVVIRIVSSTSLPRRRGAAAGLRSHGLVPLLVLGCLAALTGCGGSSNVFSPPPPPGQFSNASLNGTYAFSFSGTNTSGFFSIAGSLQADGNGHITAGVEDVDSVAGVFPNLAITGTYSITGDGRGTATLISSLNPINIAFVMLSNQRALVVRFDNFATASGSMDLQNAAAFSNLALQGGFAFNLAGIDNIGTAFGTAGNLTLDNVGNISTGTQDFNDDGTLHTNLLLSGSCVVGPANGRGTAALTTSLGTLNFAFYIVDANHLKFVEIDSNAILAGDSFRQQGPFSNASLSGAFPFTLGGTSSKGAFVAGGIFNANGSGTVTGGVEDVNNDGVLAQNLALSGSYSVAAGGRGTLTLTNNTGTSNFVIYPSSGGVLVLEVDTVIVSSGSALAQTGNSFSNGSVQGMYGLNFSGAILGAEIDAVAQFKADGNGNLTGTLDFNNGGALFLGLALNGTYSVSSNGRGAAMLQSSAGTLNLNFYVVNPSRVLFIEVDPTLPAVGEFDAQ